MGSGDPSAAMFPNEVRGLERAALAARALLPPPVMKKVAAALLLILLSSATGCWLDDPWPTGTQISVRPGPAPSDARARLS